MSLTGEEVGRLSVLLGVGFALGMLASWVPPVALFQRIGQGTVMIAVLVTGVHVLDFVLEKVMRSFGLYKAFIKFMWTRNKS